MNIPYIPIVTDLDAELPFHIVNAGQRKPQPHIIRPSGLPEFQWLHCDEGEGILLINKKRYTLTKGMGFFMHPNVPHEYYPAAGHWKTSYLSFDGYGVIPTLNNIGLTEKVYVFYVDQILAIENLINNILKIRTSKSLNRLAETSVMLYTFIIFMKDIICSSKSGNKNTTSTRLSPVINYINNNYMKNLTLEDLASIIDVTPSHFCKIFKQEYNLRPFEFINKVRIEKSKELMLKSPFTPLKNIARSVGFSRLSYFCYVFKEVAGCSPNEFRSKFLTYH